MDTSADGSSRANRAHGKRIVGRRLVACAAVLGVAWGLGPAPAAQAYDVVIRSNTRVPVLLDVRDPFGTTALVKRHVRIRPIVGPGVVGFLGPWTLTNEGQIEVRGAVHDGVDLFGGRSVVNESTGVISGADDGVFISSCSCTPANVTNAGSITGGNSDAVEFDVAGTVTNSGTLSGATSGIKISGGSGAVVNSGSILGRTGILLESGSVTNGTGATAQIVGSTGPGILVTSGALSLVNSGVITGGSQTGGISGVSMASGSVQNSNGGVISGSRAGITSTGNTAISNTATIGGGTFSLELGAGNDVVTLGTGSVLNGIVEGGAGTDAIFLNGTGTEDGPFQNFESLTMQGTQWSLGGISTVANVVVSRGTLNVVGAITGATQVTGGTLVVDGSVSGAAVVQPAGRLSGSGSVGPTTSAGTIAPGNSIGTLTVNGAFTSQPGSTYEVEVNGAGASDLIAISDTATLNGGTVVVLPDQGTTGAAENYTILTAAGGVSGTFSNLVENYPFLDHTLSYLSNSVVLTAFRNAADFQDVAVCPNQFQTGLALDAADDDPSSTADMQRVLASLTGEGSPAAARRFLDEAGAASRPDVDFVNLQSLQSFQEAITARSENLNLAPSLPGLGFASNDGSLAPALLGGVSAAPGATGSGGERSGAWLRGVGLFGDRDASGCPGPGYRYDLGGAALGVDHGFGESLAFGAAVATGNSNTHVKQLFDNLYALHAHGAVYGAWTPDLGRDLRVSGAFTAGWIGNDTTRSIVTTELRRQAQGEFDSLALSGALEVSAIAFRPAGFLIRPRLGLRFFHLGDDSYTESGANSLGLVVEQHDVQSLQSELGAHVARRFDLGSGWTLDPGVEAAWGRELLSVDETVSSRFSGSTVSGFQITGDRPERNRALVGAGVVAQMNRSLALSVRYLADLASDETSQSIQGGVRLAW